MFSIEISFADGVSRPETILVRRPQALIGASDYAHVVIDDLRELNYQVRLIREAGRRFRTKPVSSANEGTGGFPELNKQYEGSAALNLGKVRLLVSALDSDLHARDNEPPDRAGVRTLRQTCSSRSPVFPAVLVRGAFPMVVSFSSDQPVFIGRSKQCAVRLDSADISGRHARMGYENGQFWIEDLGSTNGTFVDGQQISGRVNLAPGAVIVMGREVSLRGVLSEQDLESATRTGSEPQVAKAPEKRYPILYSLSELVRPAKVVLVPGLNISIGRDPANEIWVGAPHISRRHCSVSIDPSGIVRVTDSSTNGTGYEGGILRTGETLEVAHAPQVIDLGSGVTIGICFSEVEEQRFKSEQGVLHTFGRATSNPTQQNLAARAQMAMTGQTDTKVEFEGQKGRSRKPTQALNEVVSMYNQASNTGRAVLLIFAVVMVLVFAVIVNLLLPVWFR
ncbi:MAG: FHA domain-containing protein [Proteobacteria bacterium]|nr:FHA domain-containing protein [Pseudomonadota bacterium]